MAPQEPLTVTHPPQKQIWVKPRNKSEFVKSEEITGCGCKWPELVKLVSMVLLGFYGCPPGGFWQRQRILWMIQAGQNSVEKLRRGDTAAAVYKEKSSRCKKRKDVVFFKQDVFQTFFFFLFCKKTKKKHNRKQMHPLEQFVIQNKSGTTSCMNLKCSRCGIIQVSNRRETFPPPACWGKTWASDSSLNVPHALPVSGVVMLWLNSFKCKCDFLLHNFHN